MNLNTITILNTINYDNYIMNAVINGIGLVIMLIILLNYVRHDIRMFYDKKLFLFLILSIILMLIIDTIPWMVDGLTTTWAYQHVFISNFLLYLFNPIAAFIWVYYLDYKIFRSKEGLMKRIIYYLVPILINTVLVILTIFENVYFEVGSNNRYSRGPLFWVSYILTLLYIVIAIVLPIVFRKKIKEKEWLSLIIYSSIPLIFSLIQILNYGISLIWIGSTLSFIIVYIRIQNESSFTDFLTQLGNRRLLEEYLNTICGRNEKRIVIGAMLDIDDFKSINDKYGHAEGDKVLIDISAILSKVLRNKGFLARYAGDEFIFIVKMKEMENIEIILNDLDNRIQIYNETNGKEYNIAVSIGWILFESTDTVNNFLQKIDKKMYEEKRKKKMHIN